MTSICDFGRLPNRTSLRECLLDSISTAPVSSREEEEARGPPSPLSLSLSGQAGPHVPIENKPDCTFAGAVISTRAARSHV